MISVNDVSSSTFNQSDLTIYLSQSTLAKNDASGTDENTSFISITEVGPFISYEMTFISPNNGTEYPRLFLKESFHISGSFSQSEMCINAYFDVEENPRPFATIITKENGVIDWYSGDPSQNPTLRGVEPLEDKLEGIRKLSLQFEPDVYVIGGCDEQFTNLNASFSELDVMISSQVDISIVQSWSHTGISTLLEGESVNGKIILNRDRMDLHIAGEVVNFTRRYLDENGKWITEGVIQSTTNEYGNASFHWVFPGKICDGHPCQGIWSITVSYTEADGRFWYATDNVTLEIHWGPPADSDGDGVYDKDDECPQTNSVSDVYSNGCAPYQFDSDADGWNDSIDCCIDDPLNHIDSDGDGVGDNSDVFPSNNSEWNDTDGDGVGDNSDVFPLDGNETHDTDGDGVGDNSDYYPYYGAEWNNSDGDMYGDNIDNCDNISGSSTMDLIGCLDNDGDGWSNYNDAFENNSEEWNDTDGDGIGDNSDFVPDDPSRSDSDQIMQSTSISPPDYSSAIIFFGVCILVLAGVLLFKKNDFEDIGDDTFPKNNHEIMDQVNNGDIAGSVNLTEMRQWIDEDGNTWRQLSDGSMQCWNGITWQS